VEENKIVGYIGTVGDGTKQEEKQTISKWIY
jgi:hypothetical protein